MHAVDDGVVFSLPTRSIGQFQTPFHSFLLASVLSFYDYFYRVSSRNSVVVTNSAKTYDPSLTVIVSLLLLNFFSRRSLQPYNRCFVVWNWITLSKTISKFRHRVQHIPTAAPRKMSNYDKFHFIFFQVNEGRGAEATYLFLTLEAVGLCFGPLISRATNKSSWDLSHRWGSSSFVNPKWPLLSWWWASEDRFPVQSSAPLTPPPRR